MRVPVVHPVPVRWRPRRADRDRVAFRAETTPAEIREYPEGAFGEGAPGPRVLPLSTPATYHALGGGLWEPVLKSDLGPSRSGEPATRADLAQFLGSPGSRAPGGLAAWGTPLQGTPPELGAGNAGVGTEMPAAILAGARTDHTDAARSALAAFLADNLAVSGEAVLMRARLPVATPSHAPISDARAPYFVSRGPSFPPHRRREMERYLVLSGLSGKLWHGCQEALDRIAPAPPAEAYGDGDLARMVNGMPALLEHAAIRIAKRRILGGRPLPAEALDALDRLRPLGDLGLVGAIPRHLWTEAVERTAAAAAALQRAMPANYRNETLPWVAAYVEGVARPRLAAAEPVPAADDAEALTGLAP